MHCYYHENEEAVATCSRCGKSLCRRCAENFKPITCVDCVREAVEYTKQEMTKSIVLSVLLMIVGIIITRDFFGFLLAGIPSGWRALNKITPSIFLVLPIGGWVIYFFVKLFIAYCIGLVALPIKLYQDISELKKAKDLEGI